MDPAGCLVLVPYLTHVEPECERGLRELEQRGYEVRRYPATAAIDRTRCEAAFGALAEGFDELMWIDSDIAFDAEDVARLRSSGHALIGGVYAKKGQPGFALHPAPGTTELVLGERGGPSLVKYVGAGFLLTHRRVYADIERHYALPRCNGFAVPLVPYFLPMVIPEPTSGGHWYLGEDYSFCERARQAGHPTHVETSIRLGHLGRYAYAWEDAGTTVPRAPTVTVKIDR